MEPTGSQNLWVRLGPEIRLRIQRMLCVDDTAVFDTPTQRNLSLWQSMIGIPVTGVVDAWTYQRIQTYLRGLSITHHRCATRGLWWDIDPVKTINHAHQLADHLVLMGIDQVSIRIDHDTNFDVLGPLWTWSPLQIARFACILDRRDISVALSLTPLPELIHLNHLIHGVLERTSRLISVIDMRFTPATLTLWRDPEGCGFADTNDAANALVDRLPAVPLHVTYTSTPPDEIPAFWDVAEEIKYLISDTTAAQLHQALDNDECPIWISPASALFPIFDNHDAQLEDLLKSTSRSLH